jgi:hypothetical protein
MVFTELVPPMLKPITSGSAKFSLTFASSMAARKVHCLPLRDEESHTPLILLSPASPVLLTVESAWAGLGESARSNPQSATSATSATSILNGGAHLLTADARLISQITSPRAEDGSVSPASRPVGYVMYASCVHLIAGRGSERLPQTDHLLLAQVG